LDSDYDKYDKRLLVLLYGVYVLWLIIQATPYYTDPNNHVELQRIRLILQSLQQFIVIIGNDIFLMGKRLPSGVFGTALINCLCEAILEVLQFYFCLYRAKNRDNPKFGNFVIDGYREVKFFSVVSLINYGDDNLKFVHPKFRYVYTNESIGWFSKFICMGITPAHKTELSIEFKPITEVLFLKRTPTYMPELHMLAGKLDFTSIGKMLAFTDSKEDSWQNMVLLQAERELACYPTEVFDKFKTIFNRNVDQQFRLDQIFLSTIYYSEGVKPLNIFSDLEMEEYTSVGAVLGRTKLATFNY